MYRGAWQEAFQVPLSSIREGESTPSLLSDGQKLYPFCKLWRQRVLGKDVKGDPLQAEEEGGFDHGEGLLQPVPTGHHRQVHDLWRPPASACRSSRIAEQTGEGNDIFNT